MRNLDIRAGDVLCCWGTDPLSVAISGYTFGPSHVGMVLDFWPHGLLLVESTTLLDTPCRITGQHVAGVQANEIGPRIAAYRDNGGRVECWRPAAGFTLTRQQLDFLATLAYEELLGRPYDVAQAIGSGTHILKRRLQRWGLAGGDTRRFFCSELVATLLMRVGLMKVDNPSDYSPAKLRGEIKRTGTLARQWVDSRIHPARQAIEQLAM